ncbi:MAG: S-layer homology domain-containing protein, partial [Cyanobacteria bacterium P01_H01_bin.130]
MSSSAPSDPSNSPDPIEETPPTSGRRRNDPDEWWAVVLALLAVVGIFWWVLGRDRFPVSSWVAALGGGSDPSALEGDRTQDFGGTDGNQGGFGLGLGGDRVGQDAGEAGDGGADTAIANRFGLPGGDSLDGGAASEQDGIGAEGQGVAGDQGAAEDGANGETNGDRGVGDLTPPPPAEDGITATPLPSPSPAPQAFADVPDDHWAAPFVNQVTQLGLIEGFPDNTFKPDEPV